MLLLKGKHESQLTPPAAFFDTVDDVDDFDAIPSTTTAQCKHSLIELQLCDVLKLSTFLTSLGLLVHLSDNIYTLYDQFRI